jgi:20S proteasome alpha/beta subunit
MVRTLSKPHPKLERPKAKNMTLVAGFKCRDGFVVAADTEITYGAVRFQGHKLASYYGQTKSYDIIIGGAGDGVYIDAACQKIRDAVSALSLPTLANMKDAVEKAIATIHGDSIFKYWKPHDPDRPCVQLVCGIQDGQKDWGLLQTDRDAVAEADEHAVAGSGSTLAEYLIEKMWLPGLSTAVTVHLARQLFREVKTKGSYVGGNTEIIGRRVTKDAEQFFDVSEKDYRFLWGIDELMLSGVRDALDYAKLPQLMLDRIEDITARLKRIRESGEKPRASKGDTLKLTEFGSEYGDWFKDL